MAYTGAMTLTFGDVAENHVRMQKLGGLADKGFTPEDLTNISQHFDNCEIIDLKNYIYPHLECAKNQTEGAKVLIIKNGINQLLNDQTFADCLYNEQMALEKDTKALMYGRVVNKSARYNLCFGYESQEPDYEQGKGRIYAFDELPYLRQVLHRLYEITGLSDRDLYAEGNYYYNPSKTGIGYHGDSERKKVIGIRLGVSVDLCYVWYMNGNKASDKITMPKLEHGDIYIMSEKAVGNDWKKKKILTLRHSAGCKKYTDV